MTGCMQVPKQNLYGPHKCEDIAADLDPKAYQMISLPVRSIMIAIITAAVFICMQKLNEDRE